MKKYRVKLRTMTGTELDVTTEPLPSVADAILLAIKKMAMVDASRVTRAEAQEIL